MKVGVIGAGQMGAGIAQVCAAIGNQVILCDIKQEFVENGLGTITKNLERSVGKERISQDEMDNILGNIGTTLEIEDLSDSDIIIEAIVEICSNSSYYNISSNSSRAEAFQVHDCWVSPMESGASAWL